MRSKSDKRRYSHERVLYKTHITFSEISNKWNMYKIDILEQAAIAMTQFETLEDFRAAVERGQPNNEN